MHEYAKNRRALFDYEILETYDAGIELKGHEAKAVKSGRVTIAGAYAALKNSEAFLINADIPPYQPANTPSGYDPKRTRKLLLNRAEIKELSGRTREKGLTLVPLSVYNKRRFVKVKIGLGRAKKKKDKRETIKKRDAEREARAFRG